MSAYSDSVHAYAHAKATMAANKAANSSSYTTAKPSASTASSAASVYSDTSSYYPVKDDYAAAPQSKSSSLKTWTKNLVSDIGKSPQSTKAAGAPYSVDNRPTKM
ncbi:hypothetical protein HMPREF1624_07534 [Sporothrix schenckii ATCC 58251]|uniref:Uncharacterized protein n=1 Tax=Sporothrix schenckii (strain ATCC 58251 / de Perez 2211183) TaxID=1391915 RepID=U7PMP3_SPOS1|nr:hypothetical protein HMPREF1624_07534 [Sporothrix schenckii ATCC 58251]